MMVTQSLHTRKEPNMQPRGKVIVSLKWTKVVFCLFVGVSNQS